MTGHTNVAVVFDFDDTLAPESTSQLLEAHGVDVDAFWPERFTELVTDGDDPTDPSTRRRVLELLGSPRRVQTMSATRDGPDDQLGALSRYQVHALCAERTG